MQKMNLSQAPVSRKTLVSAAAVTASADYDQKALSTVDDMQDDDSQRELQNGIWGCYIYTDVGGTLTIYTSAGGTTYAVRETITVAATTWYTREYTAGTRYWYVKFEPTTNAAAVHLGTYQFNA